MRTLALGALSALALAPLAVSPAHAAEGAPTVETLIGPTSQGGVPALGTVSTPSGTLRVVSTSPEVLYRDEMGIADSGDRIVVREDLRPTATSEQVQRIAVYDVSGARVAVLDTAPVSVSSKTRNEWLGIGVALSPDGTTAVWRREGVLNCFVADSVLVAAPVAGGPVRRFAFAPGEKGYYAPVFLTDDVLLVSRGVQIPYYDDCGTMDTLFHDFATVALDGTATPVTVPGEGDVEQAAFKADRSMMVFVRKSGTYNEGYRRRVEVAPVALQGTVLQVGTPRALTAFDDALNPSHPSFSRDGTSVLFAAAGSARVRQVPLSGGASSPVGADPSEIGLSDFRVGATESTAPLAPSELSILSVTGSTARVRITVPVDATASRVQLTRTAAGQPAVTTEAVLNGTTATVDDAGLRAGLTYTYAARTVDRSGNVGPSLTGGQVVAERAVRVSGQALTAGEDLLTLNGYVLRVQATGGNVVLYSPAGRADFQTRTRTGTRLFVQNDGNLVLYDGAGRPLWQTRTAGSGQVTLRLQDDGNLVLQRQSDRRVVWSSRTGKR